MKRLIAALLRRATADLTRQLDDMRVLQATAIVNQRGKQIYERLAAAEFKVFSQFGDDGIIQYLFTHVPPRTRRFVELGVEDYIEANTRLLLLKDNWSGLVVDASNHHIRRIREDTRYWRHDLVAIAAFLNAENVTAILKDSGLAENIDLLSIDLDGNDYWIWKALADIQPNVVVIEYNSVFGPDISVTVPYDAEFRRFDKHYSGLYWGASLRALVELADEKGYEFVGCNSAGNNAYFVRRTAIGELPIPTSTSGFVPSQFRESRDRRGRLSYLRAQGRRKLVEDLPVFDLRSGTVKPLAQVQP